MTTPASVATTAPLKPSLKRALGEVHPTEAAPAAKMRRLAQASMISVQAGHFFANGQLPTTNDPANDASAAATAANPRAGSAAESTKSAASNNRPSARQFVFPIPSISALVDDDDDESDYTSSSDGVSDLDDEDDSVVNRSALLQMNFQNFSRTASVVTLSSAPSSIAEKPKLLTRMGLPAMMKMSPSRALQRSVLSSESAPALKLLDAAMKPSPRTESPKANASCDMAAKVKPDDFLKQKMLKEAGIEVKTVPSVQLKDFFVPVSEETIEGYDMDLVKRVREEDVNGLRELMKSGRNMQCCNRFGESIVHMAARRGSLLVLEFLFNEANVNAKVCCDSGRTPLHDACWTSTPNFGVARLLLDRCPDLLYITDNRSFTPLNYARHSHWECWCDFLQKYSVEKLAAKELWGDQQEAKQGDNTAADATSSDKALATVG